MTPAEEWLAARQAEGKVIEDCLLECRQTKESCLRRQANLPHNQMTSRLSRFAVNNHDDDMPTGYFITCQRCPHYEYSDSTTKDNIHKRRINRIFFPKKQRSKQILRKRTVGRY